MFVCMLKTKQVSCGWIDCGLVSPYFVMHKLAAININYYFTLKARTDLFYAIGWPNLNWQQKGSIELHRKQVIQSEYF